MPKLFVNAQSLLNHAMELALQVFETGYQPTIILGVWRGGTPIAIAVQEVFEWLRCSTDHYAIRTSSYDAHGKQAKTVKVFGLQQLSDMRSTDRVLIIDDTFDTGRSIEAIIEGVINLYGNSCPEEIKIATVFYKPTLNQTGRMPDFYREITEDWIVFPHELLGCDEDDLKMHKDMSETVISKLIELKGS